MNNTDSLGITAPVKTVPRLTSCLTQAPARWPENHTKLLLLKRPGEKAAGVFPGLIIPVHVEQNAHLWASHSSLPLCSAELLTNHRGHSVCGRAHLSCIQYICLTILTAQIDNKSSMGPVLHKDVLGHVPLTLTFDLSPSKRNAQDSLRHAPSPPAASSSTGSAIDCLWHRFLPQVGNWGSCS